MASWMIHLRVAQQLYRQLNIESLGKGNRLFMHDIVLGTIYQKIVI